MWFTIKIDQNFKLITFILTQISMNAALTLVFKLFSDVVNLQTLV